MTRDESVHPAHLVDRVEVGLLEVNVCYSLEVVYLLVVAALLGLHGQPSDELMKGDGEEALSHKLRNKSVPGADDDAGRLLAGALQPRFD